MDNTLSSLKILFQATGIILILVGLYLSVKTHHFSKIRNYSYISEKERRNRSIKAGIGATILIFGILFILIAINSQASNLDTLLTIFEIGLCLSPVIAILVFLRVYRDLWTFTKAEDDIVFVEKNIANK